MPTAVQTSARQHNKVTLHLQYMSNTTAAPADENKLTSATDDHDTNTIVTK